MSVQDRKCAECGRANVPLKRGWTNALYCSSNCEINGVNWVHRSMPGIGPSRDGNWIPSHTKREILERWEDAQ